MDRETVSAQLREHRTELEAMGVESLKLFGSVVRDQAGPDSDVDILIAFSRPIGLFHFIDVKDRVEAILGRLVDLVTRDALKPQLRNTRKV